MPITKMKASDLINMPGIYAIRNLVNGYVYVGASKSIFRRWASHLNCLQSNSHASKKLQEHWNQCGIDAFEFEILEHTENLGREAYWLAIIHEHSPLYNRYNAKIAKQPSVGEGTQDIFTTQQAADYLGISSRQVIKLIDKEYLAANRYGWSYLIPRETLIDYEQRKAMGKVPSVGRPRKTKQKTKL